MFRRVALRPFVIKFAQEVHLVFAGSRSLRACNSDLIQGAFDELVSQTYRGRPCGLLR
jgi:hypothetical protein